MRDFSKELAGDKCWDHSTERLLTTFGIPFEDCLLQTRGELVAFCEWIEASRIESYLEIGVWTGRLITTLHRLFSFKAVAACDAGAVFSLGLPFHLRNSGIPTFLGDSHSAQYEAWRSQLGHVDLVLIDGDHSYEGVRRDFEINREFPHRFLAFHDIVGSNPITAGVKKFWDELKGNKLEIKCPHSEIGSSESTMGIGIWWE